MFWNNPNKEEVTKIMEKNEEIKEATVVVKQMSEDEKMQRLAFLREKAILDEKEIIETATNKGLREGMEKGREENKKEIAKKLYEICFQKVYLQALFKSYIVSCNICNLFGVKVVISIEKNCSV